MFPPDRPSPIIALAAGVAEAIRIHSAAAWPHECCGILLGDGERIARAVRAANIHSAPATHFEIDPQALVDAHRAARGGGPQVLGYYHSHPVGAPRPSATDRANAAGDGRVWAIAALAERSEGPDAADWTIRFWRDEGDGFCALSHAGSDR